MKKWFIGPVVEPIANGEWWRMSGSLVTDSVLARARAASSDSSQRLADYLRYASLFGARELVSLYEPNGADGSLYETGRINVNVVKSVVASVASRLGGKSLPSVALVTEKDFMLRRKVAKLEKAAKGAMAQAKAVRVSRQVVRDALLFGDGFAAPYVEAGRVKIDRVPPWEVHVEAAEAVYGEPQNFFRTRWVDRSTMAAQYEDRRQELEGAVQQPWELPGRREGASQLMVVEAWRLASAGGKVKGKYALVVDGVKAPLTLEDYDSDEQPFARLSWDVGIAGYFGTGVASELEGIQDEVTHIVDRLREATSLVAGKWLVQQNTVDPSQITDEMDGIIQYRGGSPPTYIVPSFVPAELYNHLRWLMEQAYSLIGVSQLAATSQKPAGLNSGAAIMAYGDMQSSRFADKQAQVEEFVIDLSSRVVELLPQVKRVYFAENGSLSVLSKDEIRVAQDKYEMQIGTKSQLPETFAGRLELVESMSQAGLLPPDMIASLLRTPDTEELFAELLATRNAVELAIESIVERNEYVPPEPEMDLQQAVKLVSGIYTRMRNERAGEEVLSLIRQYLVQCTELGNPPPDADQMSGGMPPLMDVNAPAIPDPGLVGAGPPGPAGPIDPILQ